MKKTLIAVVIAGGMAAWSAFAIPDAGMCDVGRTAGTFTGDGGEFTITPVQPTVFAPFQTFCLEKNEGIQGNPQQYVLNTGAIAGGVSPGADGVPGFDPVSHGTAWLFRQFSAGTLVGYDFNIGTGRENSAFALQATIWYLEDELPLADLNAQALAFLALAEAVYGQDVKRADNGVLNVFAMNMTVDRINSQDMLTEGVPDGGASLLLLGIGLAGVGMASRRFRHA